MNVFLLMGWGAALEEGAGGGGDWADVCATLTLIARFCSRKLVETHYDSVIREGLPRGVICKIWQLARIRVDSG